MQDYDWVHDFRNITDEYVKKFTVILMHSFNEDNIVISNITSEAIINILISSRDYNFKIMDIKEIVKNSTDHIYSIIKIYEYISREIVENLQNKIFHYSGKKSLISSEACTLETYEDAVHVEYKNFELTKDYHTLSVPWLGNIRGLFLNALIQQFEEYFPDEQFKNFEIFSPSRLPRNEGASIRYGSKEIFSICEFFEWENCNQLLQDWAELIDSIVTDEKFCELAQKNTKSFMFWSIVLKMNTISWTPLTRKLIHTILVILVGSAEAERGFSIMNHIRGDGRRSRLSPEHLQDIVRIRVNGPDEIEQFPAVRYAKAWVDSNHMLSNDPTFTNHKKTEKLPDFPLS